MHNDTDLILGEKIMLIRKSKGFSLDNAAHDTKLSKSTLCRLERGTINISPEQLKRIKKFLEIEEAPLLTPELKVYKDRIWVWNDLINANRITEARDIQKDLSIIRVLSFEKELNLLYSMTYARLLIKEHKLQKAEEYLNKAEASIDEACIAARYLFHFCKGSIDCINGEYKSALTHLLKNLNLGSDDIGPDISLFSLLGSAYLGLGKPYRAIYFLEHAREKYNPDRTNSTLMYMMNTLAICYEHIGDFCKAKNLLEDTIAQAKYLKDNHLLGMALSNMSNLCQKSNAYDESIAICDQALEYLKDDKHSYAVTLYIKASALLKARKLARCKEVLQQGAAMSEGDSDLTMMFNAQRHLMTMNSTGSADYLENVAIPYFKERNGLKKFIALDICKELEAHYKKKKLKTKAFVIAAIIREIYEEVFFEDYRLSDNHMHHSH